MNKNSITLAPAEKKVMRAIQHIERDKAYEFAAIVTRAHQPNPDPKDLEELKDWLEKYPQIWTLVFDLTHTVESNLTKHIAPDQATQLALDKNVDDIRQSLGYEEAPPMEMALIDNIVISWLRCQSAEYHLLMFLGQEDAAMPSVAFWEKRLSIAQSRYLRACETLAKIRKLAQKNPLLQVNIATQSGQQVNVAGDVIKK